jgi:D-ribose pyranose/furanose isomerase RbsD
LPHVYVDGLSLAVYTDILIPRGLIGNSGKILGCRALTLLHDDQGHPLLASTHRGDLHLTNGIPQVLTCYEQATEVLHLTNLVVDREAMAADFLAQMSEEGRTMTTILKTNQYTGLSSFTNVGSFVPLTVDRHGTVLREVAPAQFLLARASSRR